MCGTVLSRLVVLFPICVGLTCGVAAAQKPTKQEAAAIAASPADAASSVGVQGLDDLDTDFILSTQPFLLSNYDTDQFLRAFINKRTGKSVFQVYVWLSYNGNPKELSSVNYETPSGPVTASLIRIDTTSNGCGRWNCGWREDVAFEVPEALLRTISKNAVGGTGASWQYKLSGKYGGEPIRQMLKTEIAGLLLKADEVRQSNHLPVPPQ